MSDEMAQEKLALVGTEADAPTPEVVSVTKEAVSWEGDGLVVVVKMLVPKDRGGAVTNIVQTMTAAAKGIDGSLELLGVIPVTVKHVTDAEMADLRQAEAIKENS